MKIVMIHGQTHKVSTYHMGRILSEKLANETDITEFFLPHDLPHFCVGCYSCIEDDSCQGLGFLPERKGIPGRTRLARQETAVEQIKLRW